MGIVGRVESVMASAGQPSLSKDAIRRYFFPSISCFQVERIAECNRKLVIVGDGACGKTSLLSVFTLGYFPKVLLLIYTETDV